MQSLNRKDLEFTWLDAFRSLTLIFEDASRTTWEEKCIGEVTKNNSLLIWNTLVNECFEKLSREEECPTV